MDEPWHRRADQEWIGIGEVIGDDQGPATSRNVLRADHRDSIEQVHDQPDGEAHRDVRHGEEHSEGTDQGQGGEHQYRSLRIESQQPLVLDHLEDQRGAEDEEEGE